MGETKQYFIGDMSKICQLSKKALRFYDKIGLVPSRRNSCNNYRYYTKESLLTVPVIKYYKQMGFTLEEMKEFIEGEDGVAFRSIKNSFLEKIKALEEEQQRIRRKHIAVQDWYDLLLEAETVIENELCDVSVKYIERDELICQEQSYDGDLHSAIVNIDFTNFVEFSNQEITGPVIIHFSPYQDHLDGRQQKIRILQKTVNPCGAEIGTDFGGCLMLSCYHIGSHQNISLTYRKMSRWAAENGYVLAHDSFERYVTDYWTTRNRARFVTEVLIKATRMRSASQDVSA